MIRKILWLLAILLLAHVQLAPAQHPVNDARCSPREWQGSNCSGGIRSDCYRFGEKPGGSRRECYRPIKQGRSRYGGQTVGRTQRSLPENQRSGDALES